MSGIMERARKLTDKRQISGFFVICFLAYYSTYLGRLNYAASLSEIMREEGLGKGQAGLIGTAFFISYGAGQLISGFLGERRNCKRLVFTGLFVSAGMNLLMGCIKMPGLMMVVWCMNGLAQSMIWSPMLHIICEVLDIEVRTKFCMYINYSVPLGTISSYGLSAWMIGRFGWRSAFLIPAVWMGGMAAVWQFGMKRLRYSGRRDIAVTEASDVRISTGRLFVSSGIIFLVFTLCVQGALKDGIITWIPVYLEETYSMESVAAVLSTMVIPCCNLLGVLFASVAEKKTGENEVLSAAIFFGVCACSLAVLLGAGRRSMILALCMLAVATTSMMSVNALLISVLPSRFGRKGKVSEVSGILNSCVYAGCALSTYGSGVLSEQRGWDFTICIWAAGAVLAGGTCAAVCKVWRKYTSRS